MVCDAQVSVFAPNPKLYSNYYNVFDNSSSNINIDHQISGSLNINKTITTIDYSALHLANAVREQNQIARQKFADENQRRIMSEIITAPVKAYDYGSWQGFNSKDKKILDKNSIKQYEEITGLKSFSYHYVFPPYFFNQLSWSNWQNVSNDGVITEIFFMLPMYNKENLPFDYEEIFEKDTLWVVGKEFDSFNSIGKKVKTFCHKKELKLATVFSSKGYKSTYVWEDKFEIGITDFYNVFYNNSHAVGNGVGILVKVRYYGDKDGVTFEQLEGRKYYLKGLIEKIISTAKVQDIVLFKK